MCGIVGAVAQRDIIPILLGTKGEVLDVGRKTRAIPTATMDP